MVNAFSVLFFKGVCSEHVQTVSAEHKFLSRSSRCSRWGLQGRLASRCHDFRAVLNSRRCCCTRFCVICSLNEYTRKGGEGRGGGWRECAFACVCGIIILIKNNDLHGSFSSIIFFPLNIKLPSGRYVFLLLFLVLSHSPPTSNSSPSPIVFLTFLFFSHLCSFTDPWAVHSSRPLSTVNMYFIERKCRTLLRGRKTGSITQRSDRLRGRQWMSKSVRVRMLWKGRVNCVFVRAPLLLSVRAWEWCVCGVRLWVCKEWSL